MFIVTITARRKNARRHIAGRYQNYRDAIAAAIGLCNRYDAQVLGGRWNVINELTAEDADKTPEWFEVIRL